MAVVGIIALIVLVVASASAIMYILPQYRVWQQRLEGEAELARAEQNRKIKIESAKADLESAKLFADAEVERAKGLSQAIEIVGEQAAKYPEFRELQFIEGFAEALKEGSVSQVIYVPTEANLPILEAERLNHIPKFHKPDDLEGEN